jgi:hypothetical protein
VQNVPEAGTRGHPSDWHQVLTNSLASAPSAPGRFAVCTHTFEALDPTRNRLHIWCPDEPGAWQHALSLYRFLPFHAPPIAARGRNRIPAAQAVVPEGGRRHHPSQSQRPGKSRAQQTGRKAVNRYPGSDTRWRAVVCPDVPEQKRPDHRFERHRPGGPALPGHQQRSGRADLRLQWLARQGAAGSTGVL